jgi:phage major head subunit gpT-like protein
MATANAVLKGIKAEFANSIVGDTVDSYMGLYTRVNSNSNNEIYYFAEVVPGVEELLDEVNLGEYKDYDYTVVNKEYFAGLREIRTTIEDSEEPMPGLLRSRTRDLAQEFVDQPEKLINTLLSNGTTATAFDRTAFFSTARAALKSGGDYSNQVDQSSGVGSAAIAETDLGTVLGRVYAMKDANGRPFNKNVRRWGIICPAHQKDIWDRVANADYIQDGVSNIYKGRFEVIVNYDQAATDNTFYWVNLDKGDSFIFQDRKSPEWIMDDDKKKKYVDFYVKGRHGAGYGSPFHIVMATTT